MVTLHHGDCIEVLRQLPDASVDAIVTDPPYGLGFMGKQWDSAVPGVEVWRECLRVLKPGAHLLAFAGTRTQHRMACAIEDAGFEIRDLIGWIYGSGFPKSRNLGNGLGSALKPALEPITMARKPLAGTLQATFDEYGTGALNVDGCRVEAEAGGRPLREVAPLRDDVQYSGNALAGRVDGSLATSRAAGSTSLGRWPANLIHDGSAEALAIFPDKAGASAPVKGTEASEPASNVYGKYRRVPGTFHGDTGSAARFFYCAKATRAEREAGLDDAPDRVLAMSNQAKAELKRGAMHQGESGMNTAKVRKNHHPTVKPIALMRYLVRLITPPGGTLIDPFMGSGSTGCAAVLEGFDFQGIELDADYVEIARARIEWAQRQEDQTRGGGSQLPLFEALDEREREQLCS